MSLTIDVSNAMNFLEHLTTGSSMLWPALAIRVQDVANVKALVEGEGHLLYWWILNRHYHTHEEWADTLLAGNVLSLVE